MAGHSSAAIAAYPWMGSSGNEIEVPINFGVSSDFRWHLPIEFLII
ncbi:hypothetical protein [Arenibacter nanhaiticus]|nr:hypothetical protein [Arenibacter nanhaiticus]